MSENFDFLLLPEVAESLKLSVKSVRRRIASGDLPSFKEGGRVCVLVSEVTAYLERKVGRSTIR